MSFLPVGVVTFIMAVVAGLAALWTKRAARHRLRLGADGVVVLRRPRILGVVLAVAGFFLGLFLVLGLAGSLSDVQPIGAFAAVMGSSFAISAVAAVMVIGDKVVVHTVEGQIVRRTPFRRERSFHVSQVARVERVPRTGNQAPQTKLYGADGRLLLTMGGVWKGADRLLAWVAANGSGLRTSPSTSSPVVGGREDEPEHRTSSPRLEPRDQRKRAWMMLIGLYVVMVAIGVAVLVQGGTNELNHRDSWPVVTATADPTAHGGSTDIYQYTFDGQTYRVQAGGCGGGYSENCDEPGTVVTLIYPPGKPGDAQFHSGSARGDLIGGFLWIGLSTVVFAWLLWKIWRRKTTQDR